MLSRIYTLFSYTLPAILRPLLAYFFNTSPTSSKCDLKTVFIVSIVRALFNHPAPISMLKAQEDSLLAPKPKGPIWVARDEFPVPIESNVKDVLYRAIKALSDGTNSQTVDDVDIWPVRGEWVGHRVEVGKNAPEPDISEVDKYKRLKDDARSKVTILFLHGGQFL